MIVGVELSMMSNCTVLFGTLVGVFVFSVIWSKLQMTSAISSSVVITVRVP